MRRGLGLAWFESGEFYSLSCAVLWAVALVLFRKGNAILPPVVLNLYKNVIGSALLVLTMLALGTSFSPSERSLSDWLVVIASGIIGISIADTLLFAAMDKLGASRAAVVNTSYTPLVILSAFFYLDEGLGWEMLLSTVLIGGGIIIGTWDATARSSAPTRAIIYAVMVGLASNLLMAVGIVMVKPVLLVSDALWLTSLRMFAALPLLLVQCASRSEYRKATLYAFTPGKHWKILLPSALIGAYAALILWVLGFKYTLAGISSVLTETSTILTMLLAAVFLGERLTWRKTVAVSLGFVGIMIVVL